MSVPNVNCKIKYIQNEEDLAKSSVLAEKYGGNRKFYSSRLADDYMKYMDKGSKEKTDYISYAGDEEKSCGVFDKSGLLTGRGKQKLRQNLRKTKSIIWDCLLTFQPEFGQRYCNDYEQAYEMMKREMPRFLKDQKPGDYLGELYMQIEAGNKNAGQYFTPYDVSKFMAEITLGELPDKPFILNEPCCGSGGMVIAAADVLQSRGYNYTDKMLVVANDIDRHCVFMAYTQLSFAAVPAVVQWQDTLTQETWDTFYTPAYTLQASKFNRMLHGRETQM